MTTPIDTPDFVTSVAGQSQQRTFTIQNFGVSIQPVAGYLAVSVQAQAAGGNPMSLGYDFQTIATGVIDSGMLTTDDTAGLPFGWTLPVVGSVMRLSNNSGGPIDVVLTLLPYPLPRRTLNDGAPARTFAVVVPNGTPNGTNTRLPGTLESLDAAFPDLSSFNGQCLFSLNLSVLGGATGWTISPQFFRSDGTLMSLGYFTQAVAGRVAYALGHPFGYVGWLATNTGALTAAVTVTLNIFPMEAT